MITTTKGMMDESTLTKKTGTDHFENGQSNWIEYYDGDELVHRSVHVNLEKNVVLEQQT